MELTAEFFWQLRSGTPAPESIPDALVPDTLADAYRAQALLVDRMLSETATGGCTPVGYKIACTSEIARRLFNADGPVFGRLLSCRSWPDGATLETLDFPMFAAEPEFAFRMAEDVPALAGGWTSNTITPFVGQMIPAIEIVGSRFADWSAYSVASLAADNAVHMGWIEGSGTDDWRSIALDRHPVTLSVNGRKHLAGCGANVMGNPLNALAWLANELPKHGCQLKAGDVLTTGVCTDVYPIGTGETLKADFGILGSASVKFA